VVSIRSGKFYTFQNQEDVYSPISINIETVNQYTIQAPTILLIDIRTQDRIKTRWGSGLMVFSKRKLEIL